MVLTPGIWNSAKSGSFQDATKWTANVVPSSLDDALLTPTGAAFTVTSSANATVNAFALSANATLAIAGGTTFTATNGTLGSSSYTDYGAINVGAGSTLNIGNAFTESGGRLYSAGTTNIANATLTLTNQAVITTQGGVVNLTGDTISLGPNSQLRAGIGTGANAGGALNITGGSVTGGAVFARYAGVPGGSDVVNLTDATLRGVYFDSTNGGVINVLGSTLIDGSSHTVANTAQIEVQDGANLTLSGVINNANYYSYSGIFLDAVTGSATNTELLIQGAVTLDGSTGGGTLGLSNSLSNVIDGAISGGALDNVNNTISGAGFIGVGDGSLTLKNSGVISALDANGLFIDTSSFGVAGTVDNTGGILEAFGVGGLHLSANTNVLGGAAEIFAGSSLELQQSKNLSVTFEDTGPSASLTLDTSTDQSFYNGGGGGSTIAFDAGSGVNDLVNLAGLAYSSISGAMSESYTVSGGIGLLSVSNGRGAVNLDIVDQGYSLANFSLSKFTAAGHTGTTVTFSS